MGNRITIDIESQEMVPRNESQISIAPLRTEEDVFSSRTTAVPQLKASIHVQSESICFKDNKILFFIFDCITDCTVSINSTSNPPNPSFLNMTKTFSFSSGLNQEFHSWPFEFLSKYEEIEIKIESLFPIIHSEKTVIGFKKTKKNYIYKVYGQKLEYKNKIYELQEVFGSSNHEERLDCAVCLYNKRDTIILPCYHMCLCASCGNMIRAQSSKKCPMCRCGNFYIEAKALIKINYE